MVHCSVFVYGLNIFNIFFLRNVKTQRLKQKTFLFCPAEGEFLNLNEFYLTPG